MRIKIKPGDIVDRYRFDNILGYGAYGTVWEASHLVINRAVAIKVIDTHNRDERDILRVKQECQVRAKSGVVEVIDAFEKDNHFFIIMELMLGGSLDDYLHQSPRPDFELTLNWAIDLCIALTEVHAQGIIHRDIKPQNILLTEDARVKLSDFGIAHLPGLGLTTLYQPGSPGYKSPEQEANQTVDANTDVYSLCAVLFEIWTGFQYARYKSASDRSIVREEMEGLLSARYPDLTFSLRRQLIDTVLAGLEPYENRFTVTELHGALLGFRDTWQKKKNRRIITRTKTEFSNWKNAISKLPFMSKRWDVLPRASDTHFAKFPQLHRLIVQILYNRGFVEVNEIQDFLAYRWIYDNPFKMKNMVKAVRRLIGAIAKKETICVYGDYDVDGVTATVLLIQVLTALGAKVQAYIPNRFDEGYSLNNEALAELADRGVKVIVTVDCGIRSVEEVVFANSIGLDVIITDNHHIGDKLPPALAIINPKQSDCYYAFKDLSASGVAYKLASALLLKRKERPSQYPLITPEVFLDLVALGIVAAKAPLYGENRVLLQLGLDQLHKFQRPGLKLLLEHTDIEAQTIDADIIDTILVPLLNAPGQLDSALATYQLLMASAEFEAIHLATQLDLQNRERQKLFEDTITTATVKMIRQLIRADQVQEPLYFISHPDFNPGVIGLAATYLAEEFYRPIFVAEQGPHYTKGAARSIPEFNIIKALDHCADLLIRYGGHAAAAGFTIMTENVPALKQRLLYFAQDNLDASRLRPILIIDGEVNLRGVYPDLVKAINSLAPFGYGNPKPCFLTRNLWITEVVEMEDDQESLFLVLSDGKWNWNAVLRQKISGVELLEVIQQVDVAYHFEFDKNGSIQLGIKDLRPAV